MIEAAIIMGVLSLFAGLASSYSSAQDARYARDEEMRFNASEAEKNRVFQRSERLASQEYNLDLWNMNNDYNTPLEQVNRLKEAGINPLSQFGSGYSPYTSSVVPTSASNGSQASYGSGLASALLGNRNNTLSAISDAIQRYSQSNLLNKQAEEVDYNLKYNRSTEEQRRKILDQNIKYNEVNINKVIEEAGLAKMSAKEIELTLPFIEKMNTAQIDVFCEQANNFRNKNLEILQNIEESKSRELLNKEKTETEKTIQSLNTEKINTEKSIQDVNSEQANLYDAQDLYQRIQNNNAQDLSDSDKAIKQYEAELMRVRKEWSDLSGLPLGTNEYEFYFTLMRKGQLENYIDQVVLPVDRATWKPSDYSIDYRFKHYDWSFNPRKGYVNFRSTDNWDDDYDYKGWMYNTQGWSPRKYHNSAR